MEILKNEKKSTRMKLMVQKCWGSCQNILPFYLKKRRKRWTSPLSFRTISFRPQVFFVFYFIYFLIGLIIVYFFYVFIGVVDYLTTEISTSKQKKFSLVTFVDTPGLVDGDMKYPFDVNEAIQWLGIISK